MQIKCPKCATLLKLARTPPSGAVKCPKCATLLKIGGSGAGAPKGSPKAKTTRRAPAPAQPASTPVQPQGTTSPALGAPGKFDFGALPDASAAPAPAAPFPAQPAAFPAAARPPAAANRGGSDDDDDDDDDELSGLSISPGLIAAAVGAFVVMSCLISVGGFFVVRAMSGGTAKSAANSKPARQAPEGFKVYTKEGVSIFLPEGKKLPRASGEMDYRAIVTPLGTVFMMGVAEVGEVKLQGEALNKKLQRLTLGECFTSFEVKRNGYTGIKGTINKSTRFAPEENMRAPMMNVEIYQDDGRLIVIGVAQARSDSENVIIGQSFEPELEEVFYKSLEIGPKPEGGFLF